MKTILAVLALSLIPSAVALDKMPRARAVMVISQTEKKSVQTVCRSHAELKKVLGAEFAAASKQLLLEKIDFKKKMVVVIRSGRSNAFGVRLNLLNVARAKDHKSATVVWQYNPTSAAPRHPISPSKIGNGNVFSISGFVVKSRHEIPHNPCRDVRAYLSSCTCKSKRHSTQQFCKLTIAVCRRHRPRDVYGRVNHADERLSPDGGGLAAKTVSKDEV